MAVRTGDGSNIHHRLERLEGLVAVIAGAVAGSVSLARLASTASSK